MRFLSNLMIALLLLLSLSACNQITWSNHPQAMAGVLDLRQWDIERDGAIQLNGAWQFYWQQLLTSHDFKAATPPTLTGLITVPGSWRGYEVNGQTLSGDGYATYRLTVRLNPASLTDEKFLALQIPVPIDTAHRLYIDGQWVGSAGQVGRTTETMTPQYLPYLVVFAPTGEQIEILLQISNFYHYEGGVAPHPIVLGTPAQIEQLNEQLVGRDLFLMGSIFIMGLYHLLLFMLRRRDKSPLYFGMFCLLVGGITLFLNQPQIFAYYVSQNWNSLVRTVVLLSSIVIFVQALFFQTLFPQDALKWVLKVMVGLTVFFGSLALFLPIKLVTTIVLAITLYFIFSSLYALGLVFSAMMQQRPEARIAFLGYIPLLIAATNDTLLFNQHSQTEPLMPAGLFIFILAQAYLLSSRFATAFTQTEILGEELRQSEVKYRTLFEDSKDLIFITALDGRIEAVNPACFEVLGYTPEEAMQLNVLDFYANPTERLHFQTAIAQNGAVTDFPVILLHQKGHELQCQLTATLRHDKMGQIMGYQGILHDVTAYKEAEAHRQRVMALQELNQSLEERIEARTIALTETNATLQIEIEQRQSHQQEKERLLTLAQQQSDHLQAMSHWLMELQKAQFQNQTITLDEDLRQKMSDIRQNLSKLQNVAGFEQNPMLVTYFSDTLRLLAEVEIYVEQVTTSLEDETLPPADPIAGNPLLQLSSRERQVLKLMAEGKSNPEIANLLTIRLNTVHTYLKRIRFKLDIQDLPGLINFAREHGLIK